MNLTNDQYDRLMYHYTELQAREQQEIEARQEEVYRAIPELAELDSKARRLSVRYVRNGDLSEQASADYHREMDEIKAERQKLLAAHGWNEDYLEPVYECPDCKDTGYIGQEKCHCLKNRAIRLFYQQSNIEDKLKEENFEHFNLMLYPDDFVDPVTGSTSRDIMRETLKVAHDFVETFDKEHRNLLLYGDTGVGKSFLSHCIARDLLEKGHSVLYLDAIRLFEMLEARQFDREMSYREKDSMISYVLDTDLLIIDDLGTELANGFTTAQLYHVIETRLTRGRSTIISTNLSIRELNEIYSERIFSRIMSNYQNLRLVGDDIRLKIR